MGDPTRFVEGDRAGFGPGPRWRARATNGVGGTHPAPVAAPYTRPMTPSTSRNRAAGAGPPLALAVLDSTLGPVHVAASADGIHGLELRTTPDAFAASVASRTGRPTQPITQGDRATRAMVHRLEVELAEHLAGARQAFTIPIVLEGVGDWDRRVLEGVRTIPYGATASYGEVARRIGSPGAARAAGGAVGRNPVGLLIPCHRVIAGDGTLGGYGGSWFGSRDELLALKRALLAVEGVAVRGR
jgi:methylated-DNA-[protein]-cysteine S-methyltransferase